MDDDAGRTVDDVRLHRPLGMGLLGMEKEGEVSLLFFAHVRTGKQRFFQIGRYGMNHAGEDGCFRHDAEQ